MTDLYIVGVGMTPFGKYMDRSVKDMTRESVTGAVADAGGKLDDIEAAFFSNTAQGIFEGQTAVAGQTALRSMGLEDIPVSNVENACASGSTAFHLACTDLRAGQSEVALAIGVEKMYFDDKTKTFALFSGGWDIYDLDGVLERMTAIGNAMEVPAEFADDGKEKSAFMDVYGWITRHHMKHYGLTGRQIAATAAKNHFHSTMNPLSQYQNDMSVDEVLGARMISWPLTLPMCSPISDGGAAVIICREEALDRFDAKRAIKVKASVLAGGINREWADMESHITRRASMQAYEKAGVGPGDMSVAEVHDATAFGEILQTECLGFCDFGEGGRLAESGETKLGGRIPVNTSGGLESKGHPLGATGLSQIFELTTQLRGEAGARQVEGAHHAIAENGGGHYWVEEAAACITILGR